MYVLPGVTDTLENTDKVAVKSSVYSTPSESSSMRILSTAEVSQGWNTVVKLTDS